MSDQEASDPEPGDVKLWTETPSAKKVTYIAALIVGGFTILGAIATVEGTWGDGDGSEAQRDRGSGLDAPATSRTTHSAPSSDASPSTSELTIEEGTCLLLDQVKPCGVEHDREVARTAGDCTQHEILEYMGGVPDVDVLSRAVAASPNGQHCLVTGLDRLMLRESVAGLLSYERGDPLRWCLRDVQQDEACNVLHTGEVVYYSEDPASFGVDCTERFALFAETSFVSRNEHLELSKEASDIAVKCIVTVRGFNGIERSLRKLRTDALNLLPAP